MHLGCAKILLTLSSDANISSRLKNMGTFKSPHKAFLEEVFLKHFVLFNNGKKKLGLNHISLGLNHISRMPMCLRWQKNLIDRRFNSKD